MRVVGVALMGVALGGALSLQDRRRATRVRIINLLRNEILESHFKGHCLQHTTPTPTPTHVHAGYSFPLRFFWGEGRGDGGVY